VETKPLSHRHLPRSLTFRTFPTFADNASRAQHAIFFFLRVFFKNPRKRRTNQGLIMARHDTLSRRPAKEQPPADMRDDKTANTIADHTHIPLPSLAPSIPCPASDCCATAVPVGASRRSSPAISRFCPVLGWRNMLQLLARRAAESNAFSVPDRNALWSRAEDGLLVQAVAKYSTSDVLGRDWSKVVSELPGRSKQQCKER
jgi:hypothetical protein